MCTWACVLMHAFVPFNLCYVHMYMEVTGRPWESFLRWYPLSFKHLLSVPVCACVCVCVCMFVCRHACITSENNFWESPLSFYHVGPQDQNQSSVLEASTYPLSDLAEPCFCYCCVLRQAFYWNLPSRLTSSCLYLSSPIIAIDTKFFFACILGI